MERSGDEAGRLVLRDARPEDFDYCARLYFAGMEENIRRLNLDRAALVADLRRRWQIDQVQIITFGATDVGWLQIAGTQDAIFLVQLFVDPAYQGRGIGTTTIRHLIARARRFGLAVTLGVGKTNPALRLYERLGFKTTHEDGRKFYMRRDPVSSSETPVS